MTPTRHTVKTKNYPGELDTGKRIVLTLTLDQLTLGLISDENVDRILQPLLHDMREAVLNAAGIPSKVETKA